MPRKRDIWIEEIKDIEREHQAAHFALTILVTAATRDPTMLGENMRLRELRDAIDNLEGTYLIRLFATFETGLRSYWATIRKSNPPARTLIDALAAKHTISPEKTNATHSVRKYRNFLVHESSATTATISLATARRSLCIFFSFLPSRW